MGGTTFGNAPAAGGNWSAIPWILYEMGYVQDWATLFCPRYLKIYSNGHTLQEEQGQKWPRYHHFRYAYNSAAIAFGGLESGDFVEGDLRNGAWIIRELFMSSEVIENFGFGPPNLDIGFTYPWGEGEYRGRIELMMDLNMQVKPVLGRTNFEDPDEPAPPNSF
jgi:hypothetical protein